MKAQHCLFISDLHLAQERSAVTDVFLRFMQEVAPKAQALYVLGDLFEYWIGDDDTLNPLNQVVSQAFQTLSTQGTSVYFMQGNRDVLMGERFARLCSATSILDPTLIPLYGVSTLLMHGDTLCTDDTAYQAFRRYARDPHHQQAFLSQPLEKRRQDMLGMRAQSEAGKKQKSMEIMDVTVSAVEAVLRQHHYPRLIHGHTHRPAQHIHHLDNHPCERWVLSDWITDPGYLRCDVNGCVALSLSLKDRGPDPL